MPNFATYTLRIVAPNNDQFPEKKTSYRMESEADIVSRILRGRILNDAEDVVNSVLLDGWKCEIREWDK